MPAFCTISDHRRAFASFIQARKIIGQGIPGHSPAYRAKCGYDLQRRISKARAGDHLHHHENTTERLPVGLKKNRSLRASIIALVDAFEAMVHGRPYRSSLSIESALDELLKYRAHSSIQIVDAFAGWLSKKIRKLLSSLKS